MSDEKQGNLITNFRDKIRRGVKDRASWAIDNGKIATDGVQEKTKKQIAAIVQATLDDPKAVQDLGLRVPAANSATPAAAPEVPDLDSRDLGTLVAEFASRGCVAAARRAGFSVTVAPLAAWSKDERAALVPSIARVIEKWIPKDLGKWAAEIELVSKLVALAVTKWQMLRDAQQKESGAEPLKHAA